MSPSPVLSGPEPVSAPYADRRRPRIKICGVTTVEDALAAVELGADYLGLNFYPPSPRGLDAETALPIVEAVRRRSDRIRLVGVFVNAGRETIATLDRRLSLDLVQFHGDEAPEDLELYADRAIKVFRVRGRFDPAQLDAWRGVWGYLVDTHHPRLYGGSGESWSFGSLRDALPRGGDGVAGSDRRLFIAGGISPDNARAALDAARPWGLDVCSGVESRPGHKDPDRMRRLFEVIDEEIKNGESRAST